MSSKFLRASVALLAGLGLPSGLLALSGSAASASDAGSATLYTLSNEASGNRVLAFTASPDGTLSPAGAFAAGGLGSGGGLGSQDSIVVSPDHSRLLAVNAGSDSIADFAIRRDGSLRLIDTAPSGGHKPISIALHEDHVFVLNGNDNTVSGLSLDDALTPIVGSTRRLSGTGGAQVSFTPDGKQVVVTEKASNLIDVFAVDADGNIGAATATPSTGTTPFGFAFDRRSDLLVSNAAGGAPGASSLTSYQVRRSGTADVVSGPVGSNQTAACWVVVAGDFAYTTNTGNGTITGYHVGPNGQLSLLDPSGLTATVGSSPIDATITGGNLFVINSGSHTITHNHIASDGSLSATGALAGLPASAVGLASA